MGSPEPALGKSPQLASVGMNQSWEAEAGLWWAFLRRCPKGACRLSKNTVETWALKKCVNWWNKIPWRIMSCSVQGSSPAVSRGSHKFGLKWGLCAGREPLGGCCWALQNRQGKQKEGKGGRKTEPCPSFLPLVPGDAGAVCIPHAPPPQAPSQKSLTRDRLILLLEVFPAKALLCSKLVCGKPQKSLLGEAAFTLPACPCSMHWSRIWPLILLEWFRNVWCQECCQSKFLLSEQESTVLSRGGIDGQMDALVLFQLFRLWRECK